MTRDALHIHTPLIRSAVLSNPRQNIWLKMEAMQPAGSFKTRGISAACAHYVQQGAKALISSSGGNAGIATAYAGCRLSVPVTVIVPESAPELAIDAIRRFGGSVRVHGSSWAEAHTLAQSLVDGNSVLIHPFDDPLVWAGHATLIDEIIQDGLTPDAVVLSVGGGGLLCGISEGMKSHGLHDVVIVAVETEGAASFSEAVAARELVMLERITTIANTLGAKQVCQGALDTAKTHSVTNHIVSDQQALDACFRFMDDHRVLVEPACGATLSAIYERAPALENKKDILVIVCGGMGVSLAQLQVWKNQLDN